MWYTFSEYVKPKFGELDSFISKFTGITSKDLENADHIEAASVFKKDYQFMILPECRPKIYMDKLLKMNFIKNK